MKKILHISMVFLVTAALASCYGPFNLTRKLHSWNGQVGQRWANEAVFLGLVILPVYEVATLADAIVFNSVEFWTGRNPVTAKNVKTLREGDNEAVLSYERIERRLRVDSFKKGALVSTVVLEPGPKEEMVARDAKNRLLMSAATRDGMVVLTDASGKEVGRYTASQANEVATRSN